jgi:hypothetical protein
MKIEDALDPITPLLVPVNINTASDKSLIETKPKMRSFKINIKDPNKPRYKLSPRDKMIAPKQTRPSL